MPDRRPGFRIGDRTVAAGARATIELPVSALSDHTPVNLSVHVVHGRRPGPVIFVSAAIHGDEVIGVEIVRRLLHAPQLDTMAGTLIAVPIVNTFGFLNHSRYMPDRRDLNRCFPGSAGGSLAARLAHRFLNEVVARAEIGIDLHSAAIHRTNLPQVRLSKRSGRTVDLADAFGAPVVITSKLREGSLRLAAETMGVDMLLYEAGEGLRFDEGAARAGVTGILRVMLALGMVSKKGVSRPKARPLRCRASSWMRAPAAGLLRSFREVGEIVAEGDVLATVSDPFGEVETDVVAGMAGIVIGRAMMPIVNEGDAVCHIAATDDPAQAGEAVGELTAQIEEAAAMADEDEII